jgi:hypothetical protein
MLDDAFQ